MQELYNFPDIIASDFTYDLPKERIASYPLKNRGDSKLIVFDRKKNEISHTMFNSLVDYLPENSVLIRNNSKVISARLIMNKPTGGKFEIFLIEPITPSKDPQVVMGAMNKCIWECLIGGKKIFEAHKYKNDDGSLECEILFKEHNLANIAFYYGEKTFAEVLDSFGQTPLPPYIDRDAEKSDKSRYQTVYAKNAGSVAAPTAGLHFNEEIIKSIKEKNIEMLDITLHVGPGTFAPIKHDKISMHPMHFEQFYISKDTIYRIIDSIENKKPIIAVGTTSARTIESLYWIGANMEYKNLDTPYVWMFEAYKSRDNNVNVPDSLKNILKMMEQKNMEILNAHTQLFIVPSYKFKIINALITNFHQPKSTLILLVAAFAGENNWRKIYNEALSNDYRFLSYGDCSLIL